MQKERITWVDMGKGICMLCVMLSHVDFVPKVYVDFFVGFFLAAFFVLAGYTYNNTRSFRTFLYVKFRTLIIPIFVFGSIDIMLRVIFTLSDPIPLATQIKGMIFQIRGEYDELWFLAAMFTTSICFYFIEKYIKNEILFILTLTILLLVSMLYKGVPLPWHIQMVGNFAIWMGIGFLLRKHALIYCGEHKKVIAIGISIIYLLMIIIMNEYSFQYSIVRTMVKILMVIMGNAFLLIIAQSIPQYRVIRFVGQNTVIYFAFHGKIERVLMVVLPMIFRHFKAQSQILWDKGFLT